MVLTVEQSRWYSDPQSQDLSQITFYGEFKMPRQRLECHPQRVTRNLKEIYIKLFQYRFMLLGKVGNFSGQVSVESSHPISGQQFWGLAPNSQPLTLFQILHIILYYLQDLGCSSLLVLTSDMGSRWDIFTRLTHTGLM